jgi:hypothetical protein
MFYKAEAFSQTLCWNVDGNVNVAGMFSGSSGSLGTDTGGDASAEDPLPSPSSSSASDNVVSIFVGFALAVLILVFAVKRFGPNSGDKSDSSGNDMAAARRRDIIAGRLANRNSLNNNTQGGETEITLGHDTSSNNDNTNTYPSAPVYAVAVTPQQQQGASVIPMYAHTAACTAQVHPADRNNNGGADGNKYANGDLGTTSTNATALPSAYPMGQQQRPQTMQYNNQQQNASFPGQPPPPLQPPPPSYSEAMQGMPGVARNNSSSNQQEGEEQQQQQ